jgi:hypothetical protein
MIDSANEGPVVNASDFVRSANMSQLGSYGEAIFHETCLNRGVEISKQHYGQADFLMNGRRMDVKTSRQRLERLLEKPFLKVRHRVEDTEYVAVEFHKDGAILSIEGEVLCRYDWLELQGIFQKWVVGGFGKPHQPKIGLKNKLSQALADKIKGPFSDKGLPEPYLLFRTVMFDKESPHNLLPCQRKEVDRKGWTVFLVFKKAPPIEENLNYIIAFPDEVDMSLPRLKKLRTAKHIENLQKADLSKLPSQYRFDTFQGLRQCIRELADH